MKIKNILLAICMGCLIVASVPTVSAYPFSSDILFPSFSNTLETSSTTDLNVASFSSSLGNRFIGSADGGVEIFNNVQISSYSEGIPSKGSVSAFIKGTTMEGGYDITSFGTKPALSSTTFTGKLDTLDAFTTNNDMSTGLFQTSEFYDFSSMSGDIISFSKFMSYKSAFA
ncbi:MAG: hypothetical protein GKC06_01870 [Methanomicrobiales archaeon]|nr:hypothetical protein [Methanomicrobiales archaeon]